MDSTLLDFPADVPDVPDLVTTRREGDCLWITINRPEVMNCLSFPTLRRLRTLFAALRTDLDLRDHGWFVFNAPRSHPEIAGAVFTEHGEHGTTAALITRHILETYFAKKEGRPMPVFKAPPGAISKPPVRPAAVGTTQQ